MAPARAQRRCVAAGEGSGWADLPGDLLVKVLEELEAAEQMAPQDGGWRGSEASATIRLVCSGWKYHHDTMVMRVVVRRAGGEPATDETVFVLAGRFPAITSLEFKLVSNHAWNAMTHEGMRGVCSLTALTSRLVRLGVG